MNQRKQGGTARLGRVASGGVPSSRHQRRPRRVTGVAKSGRRIDGVERWAELGTADAVEGNVRRCTGNLQQRQHTMIECPYCLAQIPDRATTCQFCTNPVSLLLEARAKLAEVELKLGNATAQIRQLTGQDPVDVKPAEKWSPLLVIFVFYTVSIFVTATAADSMLQLLILMAALFGLVMAIRDESPNVWNIALFAFAQPLFGAIVIVVRNPSDALASQFVAIVSAGFVMALQLAAAALATALLYVTFFRRDRLKASLRLLRLPTVEKTTAGIDKVVNLLAKVSALLTLVIPAISAIAGVFSKGAP
jgi:hypothetical protein